MKLSIFLSLFTYLLFFIYLFIYLCQYLHFRKVIIILFTITLLPFHSPTLYPLLPHHFPPHSYNHSNHSIPPLHSSSFSSLYLFPLICSRAHKFFLGIQVLDPHDSIMVVNNVLENVRTPTDRIYTHTHYFPVSSFHSLFPPLPPPFLFFPFFLLYLFYHSSM